MEKINSSLFPLTPFSDKKKKIKKKVKNQSYSKTDNNLNNKVDSSFEELIISDTEHLEKESLDVLFKEISLQGEKFKKKPATNYYLKAYDAADLLLSTLLKVVVRQPDGTLYIGRQKLRTALYATADYPGVSGELTCDPFGDCADPVFNVLRVEDPDAGVDGLISNVLYTSSPEKPIK